MISTDRQVLDRAQVVQILEELKLPADLLEPAMQELERRDAETTAPNGDLQIVSFVCEHRNGAALLQETRIELAGMDTHANPRLPAGSFITELFPS